VALRDELELAQSLKALQILINVLRVVHSVKIDMMCSTENEKIYDF
jgi:hypothetical protein